MKTEPQLENGYTKIANEIVDALCRISLSPYESQILWAIFRKTYGWNKKEDWIANSQLVEMTGIHKAHVSRSMKLLILRHIVTKGGNKISLQKNVAEWVRKLPKGVNTHHSLKLPKGVTQVTKGGNTVAEGGNKKLPKGAYTKEKKDTYTKETTTKEREIVDHFIQKITLWAYKRARINPSCSQDAFRTSLRKAIDRIGLAKVKKIVEMETNAIQFLRNIKTYEPL